MGTRAKKRARLGDLITAAFDEAARFTKDPREVSRLATKAVEHFLSRNRMLPALRPA